MFCKEVCQEVEKLFNFYYCFSTYLSHVNISIIYYFSVLWKITQKSRCRVYSLEDTTTGLEEKGVHPLPRTNEL